MKKLTSLILTICMLSTLLAPLSVLPVSAATTTNFAGGSGTAANPYLIETKEQLNNVRYDLDAHYKMITDIMFADADFAKGGAFYNDGAGWAPIGSNSSSLTYFTGVFDGNGHSIHNLQINIEANNYTRAGLFSRNKGTIKNLGIENCNIYVSNNTDVYIEAGGIAGENYGTISNCYTTGSIVAGGIVGSSYVGGIAGRHRSGTIKECYNMASVNGTYAAGGIVGDSPSVDAIIENCFNTGKITVKKNEDKSSDYTFAGGIVGCESGTINCCYNVGPIISSVRSGGISALDGFGSTITNCYYLDNIIVGDTFTYEGVTKCTLDHFKLRDTFGGFDFNSVWTMSGDENYFYPELLNTPMNFTKDVQGIVLSSLPHKTEYYVGLEELDLDGGKIATVYNDGTYTEVDLEKSMITGFDNSRVGKQTLYVNYKNVVCTFDIEHLALVYDHKTTTDEAITLGLTAKKQFEFVLSDETVAKITNVQSTVIQFGSSIQMSSSATITPIKPGYVIVRAIDDAGNILTKSLLLIEEGSHQLQFSEVLEEATCTEPGTELYTCRFCDYQEVKQTSSLGHTWDTGTVDEIGTVHYSCEPCGANYEKALTSILVTKLPSNLTYMEGDCDISCKGMKITAFYDDGSSEILESGYSVSYTSPLTPRSANVIVSYKSKTAVFEIEVLPVAKILSQPQSVCVSYGKTAKVSIQATGDDLTYNWYYKDKGMSAFKLTSAFKGDTYSIAMNATRNGRQVYCVVTDQYGQSVTSDIATLSMKARIATQPKSVQVAKGKTAKVTVKAEGEGLTYKWYYKDKGSSKFKLTTSFKGSSYSVQMTATRSGRQIYCVVTDAFGNKVTSKIVTLAQKVRIATQPKSVTVAKNKTAKITVKAEGEGLKYTWYFLNPGAKKYTKSSVKTSTYSVKMISKVSGRKVYCVVKDKYGNSVTSKTVSMKMK